MNFLKKSIFAILLSSLSLAVFAQNVGIGTNTPDVSSILDIVSTQRGVLVPRMTSTERTNIVNPANGLLVFDTNT
ncbi:MAG: hypothetical protein ACKVTZ_07680, partial [Bacteroidia bacterium]